MSLLLDPVKALDQIDWYLDNREHEKMPGAFVKAAGNLGRQIVEQILFVLAFYGGAPENRYRKRQPAGQLLATVFARDSEGVTYNDRAAVRGPPLRRLANIGRDQLQRWIDDLNEPSHYGDPTRSRATSEGKIRDFAGSARGTLGTWTWFLSMAAVNELVSSGAIRAFVRGESIGVEMVATVRPEDLMLRGGELALRIPEQPLHILKSDEEPGDLPSDAFIVVHGATGYSIGSHLQDEDGQALDTTSMEGILNSLGRTPERRERLQRRLRELGFRVRNTTGPAA